ncbi:hypothetical protein E2562_017545 [Oryza meyeriana var. granulata]|uniref:DUF834 domain-containing protein n=1 Tax=Oryza meyeriana var. granulata TaxID=110450 RepID=A0A6G1C6N0_9ORYZ|nr:hypothetical protein E2562_017545 [Oryza meyeriana var. granulata]
MVSSSSDPKTRRGTKDRANLAEEDLVGVGAVDVRGVEEGDAAVEGVGDDSDAGVEEAERAREPEAVLGTGESSSPRGGIEREEGENGGEEAVREASDLVRVVAGGGGGSWNGERR